MAKVVCGGCFGDVDPMKTSTLMLIALALVFIGIFIGLNV